MTYTPRISIRAGLTEDQRATLARFEQLAKPTDPQRGALAALHMCATSTEDRARVDVVRAKWANKGKKP